MEVYGIKSGNLLVKIIASSLVMLIISWSYYLHEPPVGICVHYNSHYYVYVCGWEGEGVSWFLERKRDDVCMLLVCVCACVRLYPIIFVINHNNGIHCGHLGLCFEDLLRTHAPKPSSGLHLCLIGKGIVVVWAITPKPLAHWHKVKDPLTWPVEILRRGQKGGRVKKRVCEKEAGSRRET